MILGIDQTVLELFLLNGLLAYSAYLVLVSGVFSFAYAAFIGLGAYVAAVGATKHGFPLLVSLLVAPAIAAAAALVIVRPLERLSGVYLAIASVSLVGLFQVLLVNLDSLTGGAVGVSGVPLDVQTWQLWVAIVVVLVIMVLLDRSRIGLAIRATRLDPLIAETMGVKVRRLRLWLFVASAALGAVAGVFRAYYFGYVVPGDYGFDLVITVLAMVIVGGVGSWVGPLLGAAIFTFLPQWLESFGDWRDLVTGGLLLAIVIVSREGLTGAIRLQWQRLRATAPPPGPGPGPVGVGTETLR